MRPFRCPQSGDGGYLGRDDDEPGWLTAGWPGASRIRVQDRRRRGDGRNRQDHPAALSTGTDRAARRDGIALAIFPSGLATSSGCVIRPAAPRIATPRSVTTITRNLATVSPAARARSTDSVNARLQLCRAKPLAGGSDDGARRSPPSGLHYLTELLIGRSPPPSLGLPIRRFRSASRAGSVSIRSCARRCVIPIQQIGIARRRCVPPHPSRVRP